MTAPDPARWGAVIVGAGRGERFGDGDKLLAPLCGFPVIGWSVKAIMSDERVRCVVVVLSRHNEASCGDFLRSEFSHQPVDFCYGGETRAESVRAGLRALGARVGHVVIHDAARPLVNPALVTSVLDAAQTTGAAAPVLPIASTLLIEGQGGESAGPLNRSQVRQVQTPQAARRDVLERALEAFPNETDESSALYRAGYDVALVAGQPSNIKITVQDDLALAVALLEVRSRARRCE